MSVILEYDSYASDYEELAKRQTALIAALLEACKMAVETFDDDAPGPGLSEREALRMLRKAIAKAEGK